MADVVIQNLSKIYPSRNRQERYIKTIDDISFTVVDKEFLVVVGPSGCGKSTLLRMIAGLEEISEGSLSIDGIVINNQNPRDRDIAMVFQNYALYPHMTVFENMAFGLKLKKVNKSVIKERVHEVAKMLELEDLLTRKPKTLSGGQRQRVAIGRAIIRRPKVFLFDEPLSNLDAKLRSQMRIELQKLHREINATIIYVTHDQTEAMTLGTRIAVLNKGKLMQLGSPLHLYNNPDNKFVAGFIGSPAMNFLNGFIRRNDAFFFTDNSETFKLDLSARDSEALQSYIDKPVLLGIRSEHLLLPDRDGQTVPDVHLPVAGYENMGNEQLVYFELDGKRIISRGHVSSTIEIGMMVGLKFLRDRLFFFDTKTELVIK